MKINKPLTIIITFIVLCNISALLDLNLNAAENYKHVLRVEIANVLDKIFNFENEWMIRFVNIGGEKKPYLIVPMDVTPEDKDEYVGKKLKLIWKSP